MQYIIRKKGMDKLKEIDKNRENYFVVHYSCGNFNETPTGYSPRITSIAINNLYTGQITSFSIHLIAEINKTPFDDIEQNYDKLEKIMLDKYFNFINDHKSYKWIHWNMRDANYGFKALEHRYEVLGGKPISLDDSNKIDLAREFNNIYGDNYIDNPKLKNIVIKNDLISDTFLSGAEEAQAFKEKRFIALHRSTLKKVNVIAHLYDLALNRRLKVNTTWVDQYGMSIQGIYEYCINNVWIVVGWNIVVFVLGLIFG